MCYTVAYSQIHWRWQAGEGKTREVGWLNLNVSNRSILCINLFYLILGAKGGKGSKRG